LTLRNTNVNYASQNFSISRRHRHCSLLITQALSRHEGHSKRLTKQTTLKSPVETNGIGLHTGVAVQLKLMPGPPDTGYVFRRTDLGGFEIPATVESVAHCGYATTLMRTGVMLSTVEHLLAALRGANVDNVYIDVDNLEIPILDGSAEVFIEMIERAGVVEQPLARRALLVRERVSFEQGNRRISVEPADSYEIDCLIDFSHPLIGVQRFALQLANGAFSREIAAARTFGFTEEIEALQRSNLIRGGSLDNAIVLTPDGMLNQTGLRFRDEFVRHKILDIIGDLALLGMPILGRVVAERSGHILHAGLMSKLLRVRSAWDIVDMPATAGVAQPV
jgi:UDP-3-O-[3-hydroxymyristoyl] N-acetylglucosamine deacetylase